MIKKILLLFCLMLLLPVSAFAEFKGLHPPMEIEQELLGSPIEGMVFIKGGCFKMGDTFGDGEKDERPVHTVCVDDFYMGKYEVTQREWVAVMGNNPSYFNSCDNCPVDSISWYDVQEFIIKLNKKTGKNYRLPTEAEWEYAARSGGKKERFAGFSDESELYLYANYCKDSGNLFDCIIIDKTSPVGSYMPNGLGLFDMTGNVSEWVSDWYEEGYYKKSPKNNPKGPSIGEKRVYRGSSWINSPKRNRVSLRSGNTPEERLRIIGFRLTLSPK